MEHQNENSVMNQKNTAKLKLSNKQNAKHNLISCLHDVVALVAGAILLFSLCFRVVVVSGPSMKNTLVDGDVLLLLSNVFYTQPKQGDVIVASKDSYDNGTPIIKRVIAVEGQTVDIDFELGIVYVDGVALDEPYIRNATTRKEGVVFPITVSEGCVFVLGDNRGNSMDSRSYEIGLIDKREILGKAIFLAIPGNSDGEISRDLSRVGGIS